MILQQENGLKSSETSEGSDKGLEFDCLIDLPTSPTNKKVVK